ncbi:MAG TPA: TetR/AcrR family transcriptional regulator [Acidimicrobiales bacterium]|nr:TetR/AcrR family transcriptional regulator [Acidimicrobiales bacterium]
MTLTSRTTSSVDVIDVLWNRRPGATRGPKATITLDTLATAAVEIADAEGIDAVSMQRVAERLGFTKMAVYRHVPNKDVLMAAMIDRAVEAPPDLDDQTGWRAKLTRYAEELWAVWQRHPWLPTVTLGTRVMGPNETGWIECAVRSLTDTGLPGDQQIDAVLLLSAQVRTAHSLATAGSFPWDTSRQLTPAMTDVVREHADAFPAILAATCEPTARPLQAVTDGIGLDCVLDGIERQIGPTRRRPR